MKIDGPIGHRRGITDARMQRGEANMGTGGHVPGRILGSCPRIECPVSLSPCCSQGWMTPTSTGVVWHWLTSTAMAVWTLSMATGMGHTASTCRQGPPGASNFG